MHNEIYNLHATSSHSTLLTPLIMFNRLDFAYAFHTNNKIKHYKFHDSLKVVLNCGQTTVFLILFGKLSFHNELQ
ncbi:hypothetical protein T4B_9787 [Trichinella pseudospiralis]|uniref:Uncharacterized protein n=1 Tax=Trichinella pseudospiralis TaxID=6337 RepID=A0A0V1KDB3_TRIPS|nr:hypothetical protein T4B_9787 [Trichinella pseudospiralis]KRZ45196.1 hypothetical protein T4C_7271 [Trichinella pseudospiralis]